MNIEMPVAVMWGLVGYILITTGLGIAWAATITERLKILSEIMTKMGETNSLYARKDDMARELGLQAKQLETMWSKYDKLKEKVDINGK